MRGKGKNRVNVLDTCCAFDTEATNLTKEGEAVGGVVYAWAFAQDGQVYVGRTWEEWADFRRCVMQMLGTYSKKIIFVYVHNLAYDFQFLRRRHRWNKIFATKSREVVEAIDVMGFCFKCSYKLTLASLERCAKDLSMFKITKMSGDLDYDKLRSPATPLTAEEWRYVTHDVLVLNALIYEHRARVGKLTDIPFTSTGYVRKDCYGACLDSKYFNFIHKMELSYDTYTQLKRVCQGGTVISSPWHAGTTLKNVRSLDEASAYPTVLLCEMYPMESFQEDDTITTIDEANTKYGRECWYACATYRGIYGTETSGYIISASKCDQMANQKIANGRIIQADELTTWVTDVDVENYANFYAYDSVTLRFFHHARKTYLPKNLVLKILEYYEKKTKLKKKDPVEYRRAKALLNSIFGMFLTDPVNDIVEYDVDGDNGSESFAGWTGEEKTDDWEVDELAHYEHICNEIRNYNRNKKRFSYWPWGIWCTAYARRNVCAAIKECGGDFCYCDTDSVKIVNYGRHKDFFDRYNADVTAKIAKALTYHGIDPARAAPEDDKHEKHPIGIFDDEGMWKRFKTLGAKRYMYEAGPRTDENGNVTDPNTLYTTVAGCGKKGLSAYLWERYADAFDLFADGLTVPAESTGKLTHTYGDYHIHGVMTDYLGQDYEYDELSWVCLTPCEYHLGLDDEFAYWITSGVHLLRGVRLYD